LIVKDPKFSPKNLDLINTFDNVSVAFQYTNNEKAEKEIRKTIPFSKASKKTKHTNKQNLGINLSKDVKDLCRKL
jgi:hypothetical protein